MICLSPGGIVTIGGTASSARVSTSCSAPSKSCDHSRTSTWTDRASFDVFVSLSSAERVFGARSIRTGLTSRDAAHEPRARKSRRAACAALPHDVFGDIVKKETSLEEDRDQDGIAVTAGRRQADIR